MINRTKALILGFFALAWLSILGILAAAPEIYDDVLRLKAGDHRAGELALLAALTALLLLLSAGVIRGWRWTFWLILVAFVAGLLRVAAFSLQLVGIVPTTGPAWYAAYQGLLGAIQFAIAVLMIAGYRKHGVWGEP